MTVNDLMAIATVRRLLVELEYQLLPEAAEGRIGPLSLWIVQPRPELQGQSPLQDPLSSTTRRPFPGPGIAGSR